MDEEDSNSDDSPIEAIEQLTTSKIPTDQSVGKLVFKKSTQSNKTQLESGVQLGKREPYSVLKAPSIKRRIKMSSFNDDVQGSSEDEMPVYKEKADPKITVRKPTVLSLPPPPTES